MIIKGNVLDITSALLSAYVVIFAFSMQRDMVSTKQVDHDPTGLNRRTARPSKYFIHPDFD
jgi:hypothetical protein